MQIKNLNVSTTVRLICMHTLCAKKFIQNYKKTKKNIIMMMMIMILGNHHSFIRKTFTLLIVFLTFLQFIHTKK